MSVAENALIDASTEREESPQWTIDVYQYGLLDPLDWDQDCQEHLWMQNTLWNQLVEIERSHTDEYRKVLAMDDIYATISAQIAARKAEQSELRAERRKLRQLARRNVDTPTIDVRLQELSREIQNLVAAAKGSLEPRAQARRCESVAERA